jgi:glutathione S-transferase
VKLYYFHIAPNPTKVRLYLAEKRAAGASIPMEECLVDLREGEQRAPEHLKRNPLGRLPVLELDDGSFLTESLAIIEFIEEIHPEPPMVGTDPVSRARQRELERLTELGVLFPIARIVHATRSPLGLPPNAEVAAHFRRVLPEALGVVEKTLSDGRSFLAGPAPTVADCTLAAALQFGRFGGVPLPQEFEEVRRWDEAFRQRPSAKSVLLV